MDLRAAAIHGYSRTHSVNDTSIFIENILGLDTPKDDHGHWFKEEGAPCPHRNGKGERKPRNSLKSNKKNGIIKHAVGKLSKQGKKERDIANQTDKQLRKGIESLRRHIRKHEEKVSHPEMYDDNWNDYPEEEKKSRLKHWQKEISTAKENIQNRIDELERRRKPNE